MATDKSGLLIRGSDHVAVSDSDFHNLHNALNQIDNSFLTLSHNHFHWLRDDAIRGGGTSNLLIVDNTCEDNHPDGMNDRDHPDCIQLWTANTKAPTHDISIVNNRYRRGAGHATQFIFMGDEGHVGYRNITIDGNEALGSLFNGIAIGHAQNVRITNNALTSLCGPDYQFPKITSMIVTGAIDGLVMTNNKAGYFGTRGGNTNVTELGNTTTPCVNAH